MTKKKKKSQGSKIEGLPFASDICKLMADNKKKKDDFKAGRSSDANFLVDFKPIDGHLLHTLLSGMNSKNKSNWRNQQTLSDEMGCYRKSVIESVKRLIEMNLIEVRKIGRKGGGYAGNSYKIIYPWKPDCVKKSQIKCVKKPQIKCVKKTQTHVSKSHKLNVSKSHTNLSSTFGTKPINVNLSNSTSSEKKIDDDGGTLPSLETNGKLLGSFDENGNLILDDNKTRELKVMSWFRSVCDALPGFQEQVERYISNRITGKARKPRAVRNEILKNIRTGHEPDFRYEAPPTPEEVQADQIKSEERRKMLKAKMLKATEREKIRDKKYNEALKLYETLNPEDMCIIGMGLDAMRNENERIHYLIEEMPKMEEMHRAYHE